MYQKDRHNSLLSKNTVYYALMPLLISYLPVCIGTDILDTLLFFLKIHYLCLHPSLLMNKVPPRIPVYHYHSYNSSPSYNYSYYIIPFMLCIAFLISLFKVTFSALVTAFFNIPLVSTSFL